MPSWLVEHQLSQRPAWGTFRTANTTGFPRRVATAWTPRVGAVRLGHRANTKAQRESYAKPHRGLATPLAIFAAVWRTRGPASFVATSWASARALPWTRRVPPTCTPRFAAGSTRQSTAHRAGWTRSSSQRSMRRSRSALAMTDTELRLIAAAASMGLRRRPNAGYRTPAAIGTPSTL